MLFWPRQHVVLQNLLEQVQMEVSYDMGKSERQRFVGLQVIDEMSGGLEFNGISHILGSWSMNICGPDVTTSVWKMLNACCKRRDPATNTLDSGAKSGSLARTHSFTLILSISLPTAQCLQLTFDLLSMYALSIIICSITNNAGTAA